MKFSVIAQITGHAQDYPHEGVGLPGALCALRDSGLADDPWKDLSDIGDHECTYCASESCTCVSADGYPYNPSTLLSHALDYLTDLSREMVEDDRKTLLDVDDCDAAWDVLNKIDRGPDPPPDREIHHESCAGKWWSELQEIQASGILTKPQLETLIDGLGYIYADPCETMGTLGGPLSEGSPSIGASR